MDLKLFAGWRTDDCSMLVVHFVVLVRGRIWAILVRRELSL